MVALLPVPKKVSFSQQDTFRWAALENLLLPREYSPALLQAVLALAEDYEGLVGNRPRLGVAGQAFGRPGIALEFADGFGADDYAVSASAQGVVVKASAEAGLFYGIQTLRQLLSQSGEVCPACEIQDSPDFAVRGFYHDVTRSAVPTLETLCALVDKMSFYKLNQLQLYVEHTFAFARHCDIWQGADPLSAEEVLRLQDYCEARHVELVPSVSTFGHFYTALRSKRLEDLNELDVKASEQPFSFYDRMAHYTLNPSDPRSIQLVAEILEDYLPLFHSRYANICCDETFDLGKGKNASLVKEPADVKKLYVGFLKKIMAVVVRLGKVPMFWGDIIGEDRDLIQELPEGAIPLEWDYGPECNRWDTSKLAEAVKTFYVCPGTTVWNRWLCDVCTGQKNILNYARKGHKHGATGLLNTNWGDFGNVNLLATSWYGMVYGAACSWNVAAAEDVEGFESALDAIEFGGARNLSSKWRECASMFQCTWREPSLWVDSTTVLRVEKDWDAWCSAKAIPGMMAALEKVSLELEEAIASAHPRDPLAARELRFATEMNLLNHRVIGVIVGTLPGEDPWAVADELRRREAQLCELWHKRNKPSEYYEVRAALLALANRLDAMKK